MKVPGLGLMSRMPVISGVPLVVRTVTAPAVETVTSYAVVARDLLDHLFDQAIAEVVGRVDVDQIIGEVDFDQVLDRLDMTQIVLTRVNLDAVVDKVLTGMDEESLSALLEKVDVDSVARRLDIDAILDRMDLTQTVLKRVDLVRVVDAVLDQMDLIALANEIIDGVDLPEIIRDSTGSMASETVKGVRMQGIGADQAVDRAIDRLLLRRTRTPGPAGS